jgi:hypothetical protein
VILGDLFWIGLPALASLEPPLNVRRLSSAFCCDPLNSHGIRGFDSSA